MFSFNKKIESLLLFRNGLNIKNNYNCINKFNSNEQENPQNYYNKKLNEEELNKNVKERLILIQTTIMILEIDPDDTNTAVTNEKKQTIR